MNPTRRAWLATLASASVASAIDPIRRTGKTPLRLSLAAYSFRQRLDLKKSTWTLADFIDHAADFGCDAVELTEYYFPDTKPDTLAALKARCTRLGLDVSGTAIKNDFCLADAGKRAEQVAQVKAWVEHTARLGGKTIRIFAGNVPKGDSEDAARSRCVAAIEEACAYAGQFGVLLALENHGGITATAEQLLAIVRAVKSDWFGVNLDTGNFHTADPYADLAKLVPYAVNVQVKTEIEAKGQKKVAADLPRLVGMLKEANYRGAVVLEYEAAADPLTAVPVALARLRALLV